jgi:hypothetical protein
MKVNKIFEKTALCSMLLFGIITTEAKDIYLSPTGNDTNSGSSDAPVKTLSRAITIAADNDVIKITGFIDIKAEPYDPVKKGKNDVNPDGSSVYEENGVTYNTWNPNPSLHQYGGTMGVRMLRKDVTFEGIDPATCGLDGNSMTRLMYIRDTQQKQIVFRNLTFKNGSADFAPEDQGNGLYIRDSYPLFENCVFEHNYCTKNSDTQGFEGGAMFIAMNNSNQNADKYLTIRKCIFRDNLAKEGSGINITNGNVLIEKCIFENHQTEIQQGDALLDCKGGAIFLKHNSNLQLNLTVKNTVFRNNRLNKQSASGGAIFYKDENAASADATILVQGCAFIANEALAGGTSRGGAMYIENINNSNRAFKLTLANTTFYENKSSHGGGAIFFHKGVAGSEFNAVNCTFTENHSGDNVGFVPGIYFNDDANSGGIDVVSTKNVTKRIFNTIIENNTASSGERSDLFFKYVPDTDLSIENSFIGHIATEGFSTAAYSTSQLHYDLNYEGEVMLDPVSKASFAQPTFFFIEEYNCIPLNFSADNGVVSEAIAYGNAALLQQFDIDTDQLGKKRSFADGKCNIGAVEVDEDNMEPDPETLIASIQPENNWRVYSSGNTLLCTGEAAHAGKAQITLLDLSGKAVLTEAFDWRGTFRKTILLPPALRGVYIFKLQTANAISVEKIIIREK